MSERGREAEEDGGHLLWIGLKKNKKKKQTATICLKRTEDEKTC